MLNLKEVDTRQNRRRVNRRWKRIEDTWWKILEPAGWKREGHMKRGLACPDFSCEMFSLDVTSTKRKMAFEHKELADAQGHARSGQIAVVVIHQDGDRVENDLVFMTARDFWNLHIGGRKWNNV